MKRAIKELLDYYSRATLRTLPNGDRVELSTLDNCPILLNPDSDAYVIRAHRVRDMRVMQVESVTIDAIDLRAASDARICDLFRERINYLISLLSPAFIPKGWRKFDRRPERCCA